MNMTYFLIAAMLLIQFSIYAQNTGQVTLSIRLFPIQTIEVAPDNAALTIELFNEDSPDSPPSSSQLSTFSTSRHTTQVDTVKSTAFEELRESSESSARNNRSTNEIFDAERYNFETDGDDLHLVYSMEPM